MLFLLAQHLATALRRDQTGRSKAAVHFVVGGVSQTISAWLAGEVDAAELVASTIFSVNGWLAPPWVWTGWFHAERLLADAARDAQVAVTAIYDTQQAAADAEVKRIIAANLGRDATSAKP